MLGIYIRHDPNTTVAAQSRDAEVGGGLASRSARTTMARAMRKGRQSASSRMVVMPSCSLRCARGSHAGAAGRAENDGRLFDPGDGMARGIVALVSTKQNSCLY